MLPPAALIGGPIIDFSLDLPISAFAILFGLAMLARFAICVGLRPRHMITSHLTKLEETGPVEIEKRFVRK